LVGAKTVKIVTGSSVTVSKDLSSPVAFRAAQSVEKSSSEHATPVIVHGSYSPDPSDVDGNGSDVSSVGCLEGIMLGISDGKSLGDVDGTMLGISDGNTLGFVDSTKLGMSDGSKVVVELGSGV